MKPTFENNVGIKLTAKKINGIRGYPPMFHTHCELICVCDGSVRVMIDGVRRELTKGEAAVVFPYAVHSYDPSDNAEAYMLLFNPDTAGVFETELMSKRPAEPFFNVTSELFFLVERLSRLCADEKCEKQTLSYLASVVGEALLKLELVNADGPTTNMVKPILKYCSEHFTDPDISIKSLADSLYISRSYVSKVFSEKLGYSFREYLNVLRIDKAKKLLTNTDMKIVEIMLDCGYKNQSSFNRIFSDRFGISPKEYREKNKI